MPNTYIYIFVFIAGVERFRARVQTSYVLTYVFLLADRLVSTET